MGDSVRILIFENNETEAEQILRELDTTGIRCQTRVAVPDTPFRQQFEQFSPDIVLTDYLFPSGDALQVLKLVKELDASVPVILVTGSVDEKTAADTIKAGISDYVLKDRLARLGPALRNALEKKAVRGERTRVERALSAAYAELEHRVEERTAELAQANDALKEEIAARLRTENELRRSEERYRELVESAYSVILRWDKQGTILFANNFALTFFGYSYEELVGKKISILFSSRFPGEIDEMIRRMIDSPEEFVNMEHENVRADGRLVYVAYTNRIFFDKSGTVQEILSIGNDITQIKIAERELRRREWEFRTLVENSPDLVVRFSSQFEPVYGNPAFMACIAGPLTVIEDVFSADFRQNALELLGRVVRERVEGNLEFALDCAEEKRFFSARFVPEVGADGRVQSVLMIARDSTQLRRSREILDFRVRFEKLINTLATSFINLKVEKIDKGISHALRLLGTFASVDMAEICLLSPRGIHLHPAYIWKKEEGAIRSKGRTDATEFTWLLDQLKKFEIVQIKSLQDLPENALAEREYFSQTGFASFMMVPMVTAGKILGFLSFKSLKEKSWDNDIVKLFRIAASMFVNALERKRTEGALLLERDRARTYFDTASVMLLMLKPDGKVESINRKGLEILEVSSSQSEGVDFVDAFVVESLREQVRRWLESRMTGGETNEYLELEITGGEKEKTLALHSAVLKDGTGGNSGLLISGEDITELIEIRRNLENSEKLYRALFENTGTATAIVEPDMIISLVNGMFEEMFEHAKLEIEGNLSWRDLFISPDVPRMEEYHRLRRLDPSSVPKRYEINLKTKSGIAKSAIVQVDLLPGTRRSVVSFIDISDLKKVESELRTSEEKYKLFFEANPQPMWVYDLSSLKFLAVNEAAIRNYGFSREGFLSKTIVDIMPDEDVAAILEEVKRGNVESAFRRHVKNDGSIIEVQIVSHTIKFDSHKAELVLAVDVTESRKAQRQLAAERERAEERAREAEEGRRILETLLQYLPEGIIIADGPPVKVTRVSRFGCELLGRSAEELSTASIEQRPEVWGFWHIDGVTLPNPEELPLERVVVKGEIINNEEWVIKRPDGVNLIISISGGPVINGEGAIAGGIVSWRDITSRKASEEVIKKHTEELAKANDALVLKNEELDRANERLKELDKSKSEFVSIASHELRTPLTGIIGLTQTLLAKDIDISPEEQQKFLAIIEQEGKRLASLLSELLDLTKIETGVAEIKPVDGDIPSLVKETLKVLQVPESVDLIIDIPEEKVVGKVDLDRIKQVILNLVDNAVQYSGENGTVIVHVQKVDGMVEVDVEDTGPGISSDEQEKVFQKFYRSKAAKKKTRGSGLGLTIAKSIVEAHGGRIWVRSEPGHGSVFSFTVPRVQG